MFVIWFWLDQRKTPQGLYIEGNCRLQGIQKKPVGGIKALYCAYVSVVFWKVDVKSGWARVRFVKSGRQGNRINIETGIGKEKLHGRS